MQRKCAGCGDTFEAKRSTAKYCGGTCRQRGNRRQEPEAASEVDWTAFPLVAATAAELEAAGRLDTSLGQQALTVALKVCSPFETGSGVASASKELRAIMAAALDGANIAADPLDELRARRDRKRNAG